MPPFVIFDLDNTLLDTTHLKASRDARRWLDVEAQMATVRPFQGVREALDALRQLGLRIAVVTHSPRWYATRLLDITSLSYDLLLAHGDLDGQLKPSPHAYRKAFEAFERGPGVAVGDEERDLVAADRTPCPAIHAGWCRGLVLPREVVLSRDWHFAESPEDVVRVAQLLLNHHV